MCTRKKRNVNFINNTSNPICHDGQNKTRNSIVKTNMHYSLCSEFKTNINNETQFDSVSKYRQTLNNYYISLWGKKCNVNID